MSAQSRRSSSASRRRRFASRPDRRAGARTGAAAPLRRTDPRSPSPMPAASPESNVPPARPRSSIKNDSQRALEWEILKGVMVVDERENILPGFTQTADDDARRRRLPDDLRPAEQPEGHSERRRHRGAATPQPSPMDLVGPLAEYKVYVKGEVDDAGRRDQDARRRGQGRQARRGADGSMRPAASALRADRADRRTVQRSRRLDGLRAKTISRRRRTTRNSSASIGSRKACSPTRRPTASRRSPTS